MKNIRIISAIAAGLIAPSFAAEEKAEPAAAQLAGLYRIVSGQEGGKEIPKDRLEGKVGWTGNAITGYDADENKLYAATYELDAAEEPWKITMNGTMMPTEAEKEPKEFKAKGLVKIEGDTLTLIFSMKDGEPGDFEVGEGEQKFVFRKAVEGEE